MIYATRQSTNGIVAENATIVSFAKEQAAEAWLLAGHISGLHPRLAVGRFLSDWRHTESLGPVEVDAKCAPFKPDQLETKGKGRPGNDYSHTPTVEVLVLVDDSE